MSLDTLSFLFSFWYNNNFCLTCLSASIWFAPQVSGYPYQNQGWYPIISGLTGGMICEEAGPKLASGELGEYVEMDLILGLDIFSHRWQSTRYFGSQFV